MSNSYDPQPANETLSRIRIGCAADLFRHLRADTLDVRLSVLSTISRFPQKALSYGPHNGSGLLDELFRQITTARQSVLRHALLGTLSVFKDGRIAPALKTLFRTTRDPKEILICARRLAFEPAGEIKPFFLEFLRTDAMPDQARCAANMLARDSVHSPADAVHIAVRCDAPYPTPPLNDDTESAWLESLQGRTAPTAQILLASLGEPAFCRLRTKWESFALDRKKWLLDWGARDNYARAVEICLDALEDNCDALKIAALEAISLFGAVRQLFQSATTQLVDHPDKTLVKAALRAGAVVSDPENRLSGESDVEIRLLLIPKLAEVNGAAAVGTLLGLLEDDDWRIRNQATTTLIALGHDAAEAAKGLIEHEKIEVRAAAAQVLRAVAGAC